MRTPSSAWPVLKRYDADHLHRIALPLGGIGTGTVSLAGRGNLRDWELQSRPAKGCPGADAHFLLWTRAKARPPAIRLVEGPLDPSEFEGPFGSPAPRHGLPRFRNAAFDAAYPFGRVHLADPSVPATVRIEAFNPLIPGDPDRSGLPVAILRFRVRNRTAAPLDAALCAHAENYLNETPKFDDPGLRQEFRNAGGLRGIIFSAANLPPLSRCAGHYALATTAAHGVSHRLSTPELGWGGSLLWAWDDLLARGAVAPRDALPGDKTLSALCVRFRIPARGGHTVTFLLAWHFPNRETWTPRSTEECRAAGLDPAAADTLRNDYATRFPTAWDAATHTADNLEDLEHRTAAFVRAFCASPAPEPVKEAALFNLSTLRSETCFRLDDGRFFAWEGCGDDTGSCHGSCTHVWNYENALAFLFGGLARSMRGVEFHHALHPNGLMSFRVNLPLSNAANSWYAAAADGQMGCLMKLHRDWQLSGDDAFLRDLWPAARKALEFCWLPGSWDADQDGVMEGCQHNTMDVEYYGPNPQMQGWYLGALRAAEAMARHLGDTAFAGRCRALFVQGSAWTDTHLFNGAYYEHQVRPPGAAPILEGLRTKMGSADLTNPDFQLGAGCLIDQLIGQHMAHVCGLGYLLKPGHVKRALRAVLAHNFLPSFAGHFNNMRSFVLDGEAGVLMATYPKGRRPAQPFPYFNEVMTGFEHALAAHLLQEGFDSGALRVTAAVRARYDGRKRNPFNEAECGHHYGRALAAWSTYLAWTGFHWSGVTRTMAFAPRPGTWFWSNGAAWGTAAIQRKGKRHKVRVHLLSGALEIQTLRLEDAGECSLVAPTKLRQGQAHLFEI